MGLQWISTEIRTGRVIADLPDLAGSGGGDLTVAVQMGNYQSCAVNLPLPTAPENWQRAVKEGAAVLNLLQDGNPIWGGYVSREGRSAGNEIELSLVTLEGYLDSIYVGDETFTGVGQNDIATALVNKYALDGVLGNGLPIRVVVTSGGSGTIRTRNYLDTDNKTLYSILQDLAGVDGGIEWTIGWEHLSSPERYTPIFYVGTRLGNAVTPGLVPAATFEMPGPVTDFTYSIDYGAGKGATIVKAYSSGQGTTQPQSAVQSVVDPDRARFEYRWTPSTSITDVATLSSHAASKLAQISAGTITVSLSASAADAPQLFTDWNTGDDIGYSIGGLAFDPTVRYIADIFIDTFTDVFGASGTVLVNPNGRDTVPAFPGGKTGVARAIGWMLTLSNTPIVTPVLAGSSL